jgi:hypothetical protein
MMPIGRLIRSHAFVLVVVVVVDSEAFCLFTRIARGLIEAR